MANDPQHGQRYADASCVLRVNVNCNECKMKMTEVISSIVGVYDVSIDADGGTVKISGEVDPNVLLRAIGRATGEHGGLVHARITHPEVGNKKITNNNNNNNLAISYNNNEYPSSIEYGDCNHVNGYGGGNTVHPSGRRLYGGTSLEGGGYSYGHGGGRLQSTVEVHPDGCNNYCCRPMPEAVYVPSYPPRDHDPRDDENVCTIM